MVEEKLRRIEYFEGEIKLADEQLEALSEHFPETKALTCLFGIGLYSALLLVAEIGEPWRFTREGQVGAYAGLTSRVSQSGEKAHYGSISKQGSKWMRYILVNSAMQLVRRDKQLGNFYRRIKRRSGFKVARVAAARKLAEICWKRLMAYYREQEIA